MAKRDINYIKYIKPKVKEKERIDKIVSREKKIDAVRRITGTPGPAITIEDVGFLTSMMQTIKGVRR